MGISLVLSILAFILITFLTESPRRGPGGGAGFFWAIMVFIISMMVSCQPVQKGDEEFAVRDTVDIQSAATGSRIEGSFVLGSGTIEGERYYAYWTSKGTNRKGAVERRKVEGDEWDIEVVETDSVDSKIIFTEYKRDETFWRIWLDSPYQRAEIFVPENSIRYNYDLKAK